MTGPTKTARDLVQRLRSLQRRRLELTAVKDHTAAVATLDLAVSLVDPHTAPVLREALLHACNPASGGDEPAVPVVLGPQDAAYRGYAVEEVLALVRKHGSACAGYAHQQVTAAECRRAYEEVQQAVEQLAVAAFVGHLGAAQNEGRLS